MTFRFTACLAALMAVSGCAFASTLEPIAPDTATLEPAAATATAEGDESKQPWEEYDKLVKATGEVSALGPTLFGDDVSLYSGGLSFTATDVSLPGNNKLPVAITRKFTAANHKGYQTDAMMADWELDIPNVSGTFAPDWITSSITAPNARCSVSNVGAARPPTVYSGSTPYLPESYWHGIQANMPGGGELMLVRPDVAKPTSGTYYWVTKEFTYFSCLPTIKNGAGEGFQAITADGTKYTFDFMAGYVEPMFKGAKPGDPDIIRSRRVLYVTEIEDRFNNKVTYSYANTGPSQPAKLLSITSSDGRQLTLTHNSYGHVATVFDGTRTWTYDYVYPTGSQQSLAKVVLPDTSEWQIDFAALFRAAVRYYKGEPGTPQGTDPEPYRDCFNPGSPVENAPIVGTITHPSGAVGEFSVSIQRFGRTNVPQLCSGVTTPTNNPNDDVSYYPMNWDAFALTKKRVTGPGLTPAEWNYTYDAVGSFSSGTPVCSNGVCAPACISDSCAGSTKVAVAGPENTWMRYTFGNSYRYNEGKLLKLEVGAGPTDIKKTQVTSYQLAQSGQAYPAMVGTSPQPRSDAFDSEFVRPARAQTTTQDGDTFNWVVNQCGGIDCFDTFGRPTTVTKYSSLGVTKTNVTTYADNLSKWVLGQIAKVTCIAPADCTPTYAPTGVVESQTDYYADSSLPYRQYSFGKLRNTLVYNPDGTLASVTDANNNVTQLSGWLRGIPQSIRYPVTPESPSGAIESAVVNNAGWITSVTSEAGHKTCYTYDALGRLASVTYPSGTTLGACDASSWNTTSQAFEKVAATEYGLPAGHWRQFITTGNGVMERYFDAMWRPVLTREYDSADVAGTQRFTRKAFDVNGHEVFVSYPGSTDALTTGTWTEYDVLDRVTSVSQDAGTAVLTSTTSYKPGLKVEVTNPRLYKTTTSYVAYDSPGYDYPVLVQHPEDAETHIARDAWGKPTSLTRRNGSGSVSLTRSYLYYPTGELCKTLEPETGATLTSWDLAGNLSWSAAGLQAATGCDASGASAEVQARKVSRTYDARNRLTALVFPNGVGDQDWSYTADGLPAQVTAWNGAGHTDPVTTAYHYNSRRQLDGQGETVNQAGWYTWGIGYGYDRNGNLAAQTYPTGLAITYQPNALGQPTRAGSYASNISYYPNGAIKQFTYGNGIVHTMWQNARHLPDRVISSGGVTDLAYGYDANGNVTSAADSLDGTNSRWMSYDGLDRLIGAGSVAFGGDHWHFYTYDALDNIRNHTLAGVKNHDYYYDSHNWLTNIIDAGAGGTTIVGLGYDDQGNLHNKNGQVYNFDFGNRLREAADKESYRYDALGRRVEAIRTSGELQLFQYSQTGQYMFGWKKTSAGVESTQENVYLAGSLVATIDHAWPSNAVTAVKYQHTDALGSPTAVTNESGQVIERTQYEPYGAAIGKTVDGVGYTGHVMDAATGLTYMQQRYYDPQIGRFLSVDPVSADTVTGWNFNRYNYGANNPYKFTDPDGRTVTCSETRCTGESHSALEAIVDTGTVALVYITRLAQNAVDSIQQQEQASEPAADGGDREGVRELGELEPIHAPDHPQNDPAIGKLSDGELGEAINNPANGDRVTVRGNKVLDGNTRINEAKGRGWPDSTKVPVNELPELPDNIDQDPLGPYGDL